MLKIRLTPAAERAVIENHPWVYANRVLSCEPQGHSGDLAVVYTRNNRFLAIGLYDPDSPIALRILHKGKPIPLDADWWKTRFLQSIEKRDGLLDQQTTGYRCINGESDGWPGLVLDRYAECFVIKIYTAAWIPFLDQIKNLILDTLKPGRIILRMSRNIRSCADTSGFHDGMHLHGAEDRLPIRFLENGLRFEADPYQGQKTGFFLDQRDNRRRVGKWSEGMHVLNLFSHTGGFSLYAAAGGAKTALDLDISAHALKASETHFNLNRSNVKIASCHHQTRKVDVFAWLSRNGKETRYDLIVLDPPSMARRDSEKAGAIQAYERLNQDAVRMLRQGGMLVSSSCSAHVDAETFFGLVVSAAHRSGRRWRELERTRHPVDHPATFKEAEYLKCVYLRFE